MDAILGLTAQNNIYPTENPVNIRDEKMPFPADEESRAFQTSSIEYIIKKLHGEMTNVVSADNIQTFYHGTKWSNAVETRVGFHPEVGELKPVSQQIAVATDRIIANDLAVLLEFIDNIVGGFSSHNEQEMIERMNAAAEEVGNVICIKPGQSLADAWMQALKAVDFHVGKDGKVQLPSIMMHPSNHLQLLKAVAAKGADFENEVEKIKAEKIQAALDREKARLAKYDEEDNL